MIAVVQLVRFEYEIHRRLLAVGVSFRVVHKELTLYLQSARVLPQISAVVEHAFACLGNVELHDYDIRRAGRWAMLPFRRLPSPLLAVAEIAVIAVRKFTRPSAYSAVGCVDSLPVFVAYHLSKFTNYVARFSITVAIRP